MSYINGYELLALPPNKFNETVEVLEFRADLSDGYRQQASYGAAAGTRTFNLGFNAMRNYSTADITDGAFGTSAAKYLWNLFLKSKYTGTPFVIQDSLFGQYYLVEFAENKLSYEQIFVSLFSTGVNLRQVRLPGVTVLDPSKYAVSHWYQTPITSATNNNPLPSDLWDNSISGGTDANSTSGVRYLTNQQNGLPIVRLDTTGGGDAFGTGESTAFYEVFIVMKYRAATFPDYNGIVSNNDATAGSPALIGDSGTNKFFDLGYGSAYSYRLNGIEYDNSNQLAPMNTFGLVHIRNTSGWTMADGILFGRDRAGTYPTRDSNADFGEIIVASSLLPESVGLEIEEYLITRWGL